VNALLFANTTTTLDYPIDLLPKLMLACLLTLNLLAAGYVLGGMILTSLFELRAGKQADFNVIAQAISRSVIPTKLWAFVLLVGPVALANVFYLLYLISIGSPQLGWWATLFPVAAIAMTMVYMHRLSWPATTSQKRDGVHTAMGIGALLVTLVIPAAYLTVISPLPPVPESTVMVVLETIPRLAHGLLVAVVLASLILAALLGDENGPLAGRLSKLTLAQARQAILHVGLVALVLQVAVGPFVLMTLHLEFMSVKMGLFLGLSVVLSLAAMLMLSVDVNSAVQKVGRFVPHVMTLLLLTVISMAMTRQFYRDKAMSSDAAATLARVLSNMEPDDPPAIRALPGRKLYIDHCNICHYNANMAPSLTEIHGLYMDNPDGIVQWAMQPGTRRANFSPMPNQRHLGQTRLRDIAQYMLESAGHQIQKHQESSAELSVTEQATPAVSGR